MHPERRKHVRILTIPNFGRALAVLVLVIAAANVISEFRGPRPGEYGRLISREEPRDVAIKKPAVVEEAPVTEAPVTEAPAAVLFSGAPAAPPALLAAPEVTNRAGEGAGATQKQAVMSDHVTITGGPDGLHVETARHEAAPKLTGGIFRQ